MTDSVSVWMEGTVSFFTSRSYMDPNYVTTSLVEHYPNFQRILRESLRLLVGEEVESRVDIGLAKDGSGVGGKRHTFFDCYSDDS